MIYGRKIVEDDNTINESDLFPKLCIHLLWGLKHLKPPTSLSLLLVSSLIFLLGAFIGYSLAQDLKGVMEELKNLFSPLADFPPLMLAIVIFANNFIKTFVFMILGVLFAAPPAFFVLANGFVLGVVSFFVVEKRGLLFLLLGLLPHGVFEVPAIILSCALGFEIGLSVIRGISKRSISVREVIACCIKTYFKTVMPLLVLAAFIEVYVTPLLLQML